MKSVCLIIALLIISDGLVYSQYPSFSPAPDPVIQNRLIRNETILSEEICDNNIDDDNDGLVDCEDYKCYFKKTDNSCNCIPSNTIWVANGFGALYWINVQTKQEHMVGMMPFTAPDIAWTPDGKLYAIENRGSKIYEVDPTTGGEKFIIQLPSNYGYANAMTSDKKGNLVIAAQVINSADWHIFTLNPVSGQITLMANLEGSGLFSGGDLAFSGGYLYLSCRDNIIAKIDPVTGTFTSSTIKGLPPGAQVYGIVSSADGSLYLSDRSNLHKLNSETMEATWFLSSKLSIAQIWGMANYNDNCNSMACPTKVKIKEESSKPYCSGNSVLLSAVGSGIKGSPKYKWLLPDDKEKSGLSITATKSGWYKVLYFSETDPCKAADSININFIERPKVNLGPDTVLCSGSEFVKRNGYQNYTGSYLWQDGSATPQLTISKSGAYWLEVSNECGSNRDTVVVTNLSKPMVNLGADFSMCPYNIQLLGNIYNNVNVQYLWSNDAGTPKITAEEPGWYWLKETNACGASTDSVLINQKTEGCACNLYIPSAFTPNNDRLNDVFRLTPTCNVSGELMIYNRWGHMMFQTKDISKSWNGMCGGQQQPAGIYIYTIRYKFLRHSKEEFRKGTVALIR